MGGPNGQAQLGSRYCRARYYSPMLARILPADPIGYNGDLDLYAYVGNDPLDKTDPSGKENIHQ
jgi:RHS repeat-associated protein